jgi:hypothetical protein
MIPKHLLRNPGWFHLTQWEEHGTDRWARDWGRMLSPAVEVGLVAVSIHIERPKGVRPSLVIEAWAQPPRDYVPRQGETPPNERLERVVLYPSSLLRPGPLHPVDLALWQDIADGALFARVPSSVLSDLQDGTMYASAVGCDALNEARCP